MYQVLDSVPSTTVDKRLKISETELKNFMVKLNLHIRVHAHLSV